MEGSSPLAETPAPRRHPPVNEGRRVHGIKLAFVRSALADNAFDVTD
jgi:hypothetical protein